MPLFACLVALLLLAVPQAAQRSAPATAERIADGILLHEIDDPSLLSPPGPVAVQALQLDPRKVKLEVAVAATQNPGRETVASIANRRGALAAVNGGFFVLADGKPTGILKAGGKVTGRSSRPRGAVGFPNRRGTPPLIFDRITLTRPDDRDDYRTRLGSNPADWARAPDIVGGAGLLILDGREIDDWAEEHCREASTRRATRGR